MEFELINFFIGFNQKIKYTRRKTCAIFFLKKFDFSVFNTHFVGV